MSEPRVVRVDEDFIRRVASIVVERLRMIASQQNAQTEDTNPSSNERIICESLILEQPIGKRFLVRRDALVTPLAKDTAKDRNIQIIRGH